MEYPSRKPGRRPERAVIPLGTELHVSTPGRVCLFGEHQDYLELPVVPCAISLRISIMAGRIREGGVVLELPDIHAREEFSLEPGEARAIEQAGGKAYIVRPDEGTRVEKRREGAVKDQ